MKGCVQSATPLTIFWFSGDVTCSKVSRKLTLMRCGALTAVLMKTKVFWDINAVYVDTSIKIYQFTRGHLRGHKSSSTLQSGVQVLCFQNGFYEISHNIWDFNVIYCREFLYS